MTGVPAPAARAPGPGAHSAPWPFLPQVSRPDWTTRSLPQPEATVVVWLIISLDTPRGVSWSRFAFGCGHGNPRQEARRGQVSRQALRSTEVVYSRVNWISTREENAVVDSLDQREGPSPLGWMLVGPCPRRSELSAASKPWARVLA